jgi:hypothetical protein
MFLFEQEIPELSPEDLWERGRFFLDHYESLKQKAKLYQNGFDQMLEGYYSVIRKFGA